MDDVYHIIRTNMCNKTNEIIEHLSSCSYVVLSPGQTNKGNYRENKELGLSSIRYLHKSAIFMYN